MIKDKMFIADSFAPLAVNPMLQAVQAINYKLSNQKYKNEYTTTKVRCSLKRSF